MNTYYQCYKKPQTASSIFPVPKAVNINSDVRYDNNSDGSGGSNQQKSDSCHKTT